MCTAVKPITHKKQPNWEYTQTVVSINNIQNTKEHTHVNITMLTKTMHTNSDRLQ